MPQKQPSQRKQPAPPQSQETPGADAVTIAWSLAVVTVLMCDVGAGLSWAYFAWKPEARLVGMLSGLLFFAAAIVGVLVLLLLPVIYRVRLEPPPRSFVALAVLVSLAPLAVIIARAV